MSHFKDTWSSKDIGPLDHEMLRAENRTLHDIILATRAAGGVPMMSYLLYMAPRLAEMKRVLKPSGSLYYHCDPTASHYVKMMLDALFGRDQFRNEIVWWYYNVAVTSKKTFGRKHDVILFYSVGDSWTFNSDAVRVPYAEDSNWVKNPDAYDDNYKPNPDGKLAPDVFYIPTINNMAKERVGFATQKPTALVERIIAASSNPGDMVLDPFCGCATAAIAAEKMKRQWVGIDLSPLAFQLTNRRLDNQLGFPGLDVFQWDVAGGDPLPRQDGDEENRDYKKHKPALYGEQEGKCNGCGEHYQFKDFDVDHIIPRKWGGTHHKENLQLLCGHCNSRKGDGKMSVLMEKLLKERGAL